MSVEHVVFTFVGVLQVSYLVRCIFLAWANFRKKLTDLKDRFESDIRARARRGLDPDWVHYGDETDRFHDQSSEALRVYATTALATGIGGTIVALCLHLLPYFSVDPIADPVDRIQRLLEEFGIALLSSAFGVVNNLIILLILLPLAQRRFRKALRETQATLRTVSTENTPTEMLADAVRSQLGEAFRDAVRTFPEAFAQLEGSVKALGSVVEMQSATVISAASGLKTSAAALADASNQLTPATTELSSSVVELRTLPAALASTLHEARDAWTQEIRSDQQAFLEQLNGVLTQQKVVIDEISVAGQRQQDLLRSWTGDISEAVGNVVEAAKHQEESVRAWTNAVVEAVNDVPNIFANQIQQQANSLGSQFGAEARNQVTDLMNAIEQGNKQLAEALNTNAHQLRSWTGDISEVVKDVVEGVRSQAEQVRAWADTVVEAVHDVPNIFANQIQQQANTLGSQFGAEARNQVTDLMNAIEQGNKQLTEVLNTNALRLQNNFLNSTSDVVHKTLEKLYADVESSLIVRLDNIGRGLQEGLVKLPAYAKGFAESLSTADHNLRDALGDIGKSAEHFERVARTTGDLENKLAEAMQKASSEHLGRFEPLYIQTSELVASLQNTHRQINDTIAAQVKFIERLIGRLAERRTEP